MPRSRASARRLWLFRLTSVFLAPLLLLGALELGLRLGHYGYPTSFYIDSGRAGISATNYRFGWRFFPPAIARLPEPHFLSAKRPGAIRIFVLGESAALGVPNPSFSFGRILEVLLRERYPGVTFEVVSAAMTAINSHAALEIARDCSAFDPDLFVVYMGNNEVVGPYGPGTVFQDWSPSLPLIRSTLELRSTRTGQLLASATRALRPERSPAIWRGMTMVMDNPVAADDPRLVPTYENFRRNLADICRVGRRAGAAVVLATVPVNLRDCPPFASKHRVGLRASELDAWQSIYRAAIELAGAKQWREALTQYERAARLDDRFAELRFRMGECLLALGRPEEARACFLAARDLDVLRFRADQRINETIREVSAERGGGVYLTDVERALAASASATGGIPGKEAFFEHVHLTFDGNYLVARALLEGVERALPQLAALPKAESVPTREMCAQALTLTPWDEHVSFERMIDMMSPPPFSNQLGHAERIAAMRARSESLAKLSLLPESRRLYEAALASAPHDWGLHYRYGQLLLDAGEPQRAADHMYAALRASPWNLPLHVDLGRAESVNGRNTEAAGLFQKALEMYPNHLIARAGLVAALARQGRLDEATAHLRKAVEIDPTSDAAHMALGNALDERGDADGAIAQFRKALEISPEDALAYQNLGAVLAEQGRTDEAVESFRKAVGINPGFAAAHVNLGVALSSQGDPQGAMAHFRAALVIDPGDPVARYNLGMTMARLGRIDEGAAQLRKAVDVSPRYAAAHLGLAQMAGEQGRIDEAMAHARRAVDIEPRNETAYYLIGQLLASRGRVEDAMASYGQALAIRPDFADARRRLESLSRAARRQ